MSVVARIRTTISPGAVPAATSSATLRASARASASRHGDASPSSSQSAPLSTSSSSTRGSSLSSPASPRPATSGLKRSPSSVSNAAFSDLEDLWARAKVDPQRLALAAAGELLATSLEQLHVGVPEAVDRLLCVADREQVRARDQLDQLELDAIGVLELIDHDPLKAARVALAQLGGGAKQLERQQFEILEVDAGDRPLARLVACPEGRQESVEPVTDRTGRPGRAHGAVGAQRLPVGRAGVRAQRRAVGRQLDAVEIGRPQGLVVEQRNAALEPSQRLEDLDARRGDSPELGGDSPRGARELALSLGTGIGRPDREPRHTLAAAAQLCVDRPGGRPQRTGAVVRDQIHRPGAGARQVRERLVEGGDRERIGLIDVEHDERRIEPGGERAGAQDPRTEAMDRRDERPLGRARLIDRAELAQARADPLAQLPGSLLGERDREHRRDIDPVFDHRACETLDEHRRLAAAGARIEQQVAVAALDRAPLLVGPCPERRHRLRPLPSPLIGCDRSPDTHSHRASTSADTG